MSSYKGRCPGCAKDFSREEDQVRKRFKHSETMVGSCPECGKTCVLEEVEAITKANRFRCPSCFDEDVILTVRMWAELFELPGGKFETKLIGDDEESWNEGSLMKCRSCGHFSMAKRFDRARAPEGYLVVGDSDCLCEAMPS